MRSIFSAPGMQESNVCGCSKLSQTLSIGALKVNLPSIINEGHLLRFGVILVFAVIPPFLSSPPYYLDCSTLPLYKVPPMESQFS
jgi:hypothetical protein